jgi:preprotein translocase subunit SecG
MEMVVLIIHLLVCICLIGLVLLQRSEGGALGMGGGSGSLMSGRGAADALAKMTTVAGGFFLVTSLSLTVLSGAAATGASSVFDMLPRSEQTAPAPAPVAPAPDASPEPARPDPTESSVPATTQLASADVAPAPTSATTRAMPLGPSSAAAATPPPAQRTTTVPARSTGGAVVPASATTTNRPAGATPARTTPTAPAPNRSTGGTTPASSLTNTPPLILPNTSGGVSGITLSDDPAAQPESLQIGNGVEAVRRDQRAGPEQ